MPNDAVDLLCENATDVPAGVGAAIQLRGVCKRYGAFTAVDNLDLDIRAGEFVSLLGPSGSGKTTTLMLLAGFERPDAGQITLGGRVMTAVPPHRRGLGMVFQNYALFPHMTVAENVGFALKQRGVRGDERARRIEAALDLVRLPGHAGRYPQQLSGGQQQRVAIARALVFDPPVLLMDEPLSALDKKLREEMQFEIKRLHDRLKITFVYVTHDQREALIMSDRVVVMNKGRVMQVDAPARLYDRPANRFVASFVGDANFIPVQARDDAGSVSFAGCDLSAESGRGETLMVRPEKINLSPTVMAGYNSLPGLVTEAIFMGDMIRCVVRIAPDRFVTVKQQHRAGTQAPSPGEAVRLSWAVADSLLVDEPLSGVGKG